jgi:hypothetical protein
MHYEKRRSFTRTPIFILSTVLWLLRRSSIFERSCLLVLFHSPTASSPTCVGIHYLCLSHAACNSLRCIACLKHLWGNVVSWVENLRKAFCTQRDLQNGEFCSHHMLKIKRQMSNDDVMIKSLSDKDIHSQRWSRHNLTLDCCYRYYFV